MSQTFPCTECGRCCQNVHLSDETIFLDRGDGTCRYFDESTKHCSIYLKRPDICRVDVQFKQRFGRIYSWDEYVNRNLQVCKVLASQ
ncbi:YkgJ family cysteine cluster protein [Oryzisolibacter sp. LB2S]|uniref:YkgJ family cysteine cluster protein n=1 Tax=Alicycliphilus soli TaxID=3228789 RepID=UPI00345AA989